MSETVEPDTVHTPALLGSAESATASPEVAVAPIVYAGPATVAPDGGAVEKLMVCASRPITNVLRYGKRAVPAQVGDPSRSPAGVEGGRDVRENGHAVGQNQGF